MLTKSTLSQMLDVIRRVPAGVASLSFLLLIGGCATPAVWSGVGDGAYHAGHVADLDPGDAGGRGRAVLVRYRTPQGQYVARVPADADWRATGAAAAEELAPHTLDAFGGRAGEAARLAANATLERLLQGRSVESARASIAIGPSERLPHLQMVRDIDAGTIGTGERDWKVLYFWPPDGQHPAPRGRRHRTDPPRWLIVPSRVPQSARESVAPVTRAAALTPLALLYDLTVAPVTAAVYFFLYTANPP
ncbi:MAG TPA: hypothetical protein VF624_07090 [Tepidisphaeraceae bacterium]|jgi:hypothetical protein